MTRKKNRKCRTSVITRQVAPVLPDTPKTGTTNAGCRNTFQLILLSYQFFFYISFTLFLSLCISLYLCLCLFVSLSDTLSLSLTFLFFLYLSSLFSSFSSFSNAVIILKCSIQPYHIWYRYFIYILSISGVILHI